MGMEYRVKFKRQEAAQVDNFLRSLACFAEFDEQWKAYNYREDNNTGRMSSAAIRIEDEGLYLCDYGMSRHLFGLIVTKLISEFGLVEIDDYEP